VQFEKKKALELMKSIFVDYIDIYIQKDEMKIKTIQKQNETKTKAKQQQKLGSLRYIAILQCELFKTIRDS
jgi:hypothetical protein